MVAAQLGQIAAGDDAELGRERLEQHREEIGEQDDPEQIVVIASARLDVRREVARVHIGDRGDDGGASEGQQRPHAAALSRQHLVAGEHGPVGARERLGG